MSGSQRRGRRERLPAPPGSSLWTVLFQRNFGAFFTASMLSNVGTWLQNIAAGLLVYDLTRSTLAVGVVNFAQFFGALVLAPLSGAAADRFDRRRLLILTQCGASTVGAVLAIAVLTGTATAGIVIAASFVLGIAIAFANPAMMALVPMLVSDEELESAVALNSVTFNLARAIGPVIGALLVETAGYGLAFGLNALSFLSFALVLLVIVRPRPQVRHVGQRPRFIESLRLVRANRRLAMLLLAVMGLSMSSDPINTLSPELVRDVFRERDLYVGLLVGSFGAGATLTALLFMSWIRRLERVLPHALILQGIGVAGYGLAPTIHLSMLSAFFGGAGFIMATTRATARLHAEVNDAQRGRIMALWGVAFLGSRPIAALIDGTVAELAGARAAAVVMALPALVIGIVLLRALPPAGGPAFVGPEVAADDSTPDGAGGTAASEPDEPRADS
ncbi:MAG: MFS transporter [Nitriliruptoraceae bacterium]